MDKKQILNAMQKIFRDNFDDQELILTRETCADDIEGWDSLEQINLLSACETEFSLHFQLSDIRNLRNVGDLVDLIAQMKG